jgi:putative ABC transport system permease protein
LVYAVLPWFNSFVGKQLSFSFLGTGSMILSLVALFIFVVLLSGLYPALYLSGFNPTTIMRGADVQKGGGKLFRKGLVVFQFTLSVILIIGTVVVYLQLQHMQNKELGFDDDQVVVMPITQTLIAWEFQQFKEKALTNPNIRNVAGSSKLLASDAQFFSKYSPANQPGAPPTNMALDVTYDFFDTYNIEIIAGRTFSRERATDSEQAIVINESMLKQIDADTPSEALGKVFHYTTADDKRESYNVIGVVEDFNYTSIKKEISPLVIEVIEGVRPTVGNIEFASVRLSKNGIENGLDHIRKVWKEVNHIDPFTYFFHDKELAEIYASERKMSNVAALFSILCVFVACLGLFGLASFTASLRTKEIGIRKALGASIPAIVSLLSKDYIKLVVLANIIAWPISYYLVVQWLQDFPSRIAMGWNLIAVFLAVGVISLLICMATVSYQSVRAALVNPVDSIRQE